MATPAERIYEAAAARLNTQQQRVAQITSGVAPVGAAAAATALLTKPALVNVDRASVDQVIGLVASALGVALVLFGAVTILRGVEMKYVEPAKLLETARKDPRILMEKQRFHLEAAETLGETKRENDKALKRLEVYFLLMAGGLVAELIGLTVAAAVHF